MNLAFDVGDTPDTSSLYNQPAEILTFQPEKFPRKKGVNLYGKNKQL